MDVDGIIKYENGEMDNAEFVKFFADGIKSGFVYQLQGHYHRVAAALIAEGLVTEGGDLTERGQAIVNRVSTYIEDVETDRVQLSVYECSCGFHLGIDATFLCDVDDVTIACPACKSNISTHEVQD